ncbi:hypothetical protein HHK36_000806 [Tetracentron sinense]|uniref:Peroxidase n=1 Tax=Tetracentron sinense TaxID=13715 RepID=A0A834ZSL6_TETSI|nr:hypothetical protein HHK36_000806 [Tetracentron sinense]
MKFSAAAVTLLGLGLILVNLTGFCYGALQVGFYKGKCLTADVETIVAGVVRTRFVTDQTIVAALLRLQFHDCFVKGCDASILLDGTSSEKTAPPNLSVRGYDIIDQAKAAVEKICPGVVSCADIIAIATRDAVSLSGGLKYSVQTGRRDGLISLASNVNLPSPSISVSQSVAAFAQKRLSPTDMVLLLGGHTVGITHCSFIKNRLYNFNNTGKPDPTMDTSLAKALRLRCPQNSNTDNTINLDQNTASSLTVDNSYYKQLLLKKGILQIDQALTLDPSTNATVVSFASGSKFPVQFGNAMVKLGAIEVITDPADRQGEIRRSCRATNKVSI